ncbi:sulfotransferase family 2 domain-containing protein [Phaeobacter inhibens]|uniref:sulfotransferase family 2 domain-containing protein n=1 Tax=Phaeobacter inhibens TaxID=221822 RepID=UPI0021A82C39|nr:sulfotransferase family 2 domain-containing protein [Phaeobacter inhibens]UWR80315.1 sulfotransferase family 2 domain-containing protein [Phaeobacter inhibens]UWS08062.1 sulfotransferase family 2 domain-containing protein [Phaeobacter inhibens]
MPQNFDYFVVFAEMRTGSNFLEANLNALEGVTCHGEAFNPHFISYPNCETTLGWTQQRRDGDALGFLDCFCRAEGGLNGFRYFHDHDPRVLDQILDDPQCAKIILTRNPAESYVSHQIAKRTGQWKLTNVKRRKTGLATINAEEFARHVTELQNFQVTLLNRLQKSGQTAFYVAYEDLQDLEVLNGLAKWLGVGARLDQLDDSLKPQNPTSLEEKVANPQELDRAMAGLDRFNLSRTPNFESRRGPVVPEYVAGQQLPLLYLPISGGPTDVVCNWMARQEPDGSDALISGMNQKQLRQWKRGHPGFRSLTVLRHPVARLHHVFCTRILDTGPGSLRQIRNLMRNQFKVPLPKDPADGSYTRDQHRLAFARFVEVIGANLSGQTGFRTDASWATQAQTIAGFATIQSPDLILREADLARTLPDLARWLGQSESVLPNAPEMDHPYQLTDIYDAELEAQIASVYQRDYLLFGFGDWGA